ncbi:cytochrome P450 [Paraphoma chrysanthemicola]|uniref:Cytochrome P450 n=1 Tax=Paraphoma chrysanthemicola TaxID=798071 RepID=A0A8K0QU67_9PLEO|nr:cytochrome P450 [Paraphoma chrysanthemicola]
MALIPCIIISLLELGLLHHFGFVSQGSVGPYFLFLVGFQFCSIQAFNIMIWPFWLSPLRKLPGPKGGTFLFGQTINQAQALPSQLETSWMKEHPEAPFIRYLWIFNREVLMVNNIRAQKDVLQTKCYSFKKPGYWERVVGEISGRGILFTEGLEHRKQRRLLLAPFSLANIKRLLPFFQQKASETTAIILKSLDRREHIIEMSGLLARTTLDVVGLAALGYELNSLSTSSPLAENYEKIFEYVTPLQILISVVNQFVPIRPFLPFKANKDYVRANSEVRRILRHLIGRRKSQFREGKIQGEKSARDLLTLMIEESKDTWSEEEMLGYVKIQENIASSTPSQPELDGLSYLNNFTREVLRYYPPAPNFPREAVEDVVIDGTLVPKGTLVMLAPAAPNFNPHIWGPTADQFDPDRYDDLPELAKDAYASASFSNGPRVCIGKQFALLEFKVILVELVRNFEFENTGPVEPQKSGPSLRPLGGMKLKVRTASQVASADGF